MRACCHERSSRVSVMQVDSHKEGLRPVLAWGCRGGPPVPLAPVLVVEPVAAAAYFGVIAADLDARKLCKSTMVYRIVYGFIEQYYASKCHHEILIPAFRLGLPIGWSTWWTGSLPNHMKRVSSDLRPVGRPAMPDMRPLWTCGPGAWRVRDTSFLLVS